MVIVEGMLAFRAFGHKMDDTHLKEKDDIVVGFGKAASIVLFGYFSIKIVGIAAGDHWHLLFTPYGAWFLLEMVGFVLIPCFMYAVGVRDKNYKLIKVAAVMTVLGIVLNRLNICIIAFNYQLPFQERYVPHWMEIGISAFVVTLGIVAYRFIVSRMPILYEHPDYSETH
jgi:hypothetical protein